MTERIKNKIFKKNYIHKSYISNGKTAIDYQKLHDIGSEISQMISKRKKEYYDQLSKKLNDPLTSSKTYWSILKTFYSGTKIPLIPPIIIDNKVITNFRGKANVFNNFFASKCMSIVNDSTLPFTIMYRTENKLSTISFKDEDVLKIIKSLNKNKADGHDDISIWLLQSCGAEVVKPLSLIFKNCIQYGIFPNLWKKSNIVPIHKKGDKQCIVNYHPVLLLPICGKIFERLIFNPVFEFLEENKLLSPNQSGFRPNDSCENLLLSIVHSIYADFDQCPSLKSRRSKS